MKIFISNEINISIWWNIEYLANKCKQISLINFVNKLNCGLSFKATTRAQKSIYSELSRLEVNCSQPSLAICFTQYLNWYNAYPLPIMIIIRHLSFYLPFHIYLSLLAGKNHTCDDYLWLDLALRPLQRTGLFLFSLFYFAFFKYNPVASNIIVSHLLESYECWLLTLIIECQGI